MGDDGQRPPVEAYRTLCTHYTRGCSFVSPCCGKVYPCRLCHDEKEDTHKVDRYKISEVICRKCQEKQQASGSCAKCGINFGRYYCSVCHLYADEDKQQFHCDKCGLCRVGGRENFFHCDMCGYCLSLSVRSNHHCRREASRDNCPVCMEDLHTSRCAIQPTECGHLLHHACYTQMLHKGLYQCPQCQRSIVDMSSAWQRHDEERASWQMPQHLQNFKVKVKCRDCLKETESSFHVVGLKCGECGSYNTVRCGNEEIPEDEGGQEGAVGGGVGVVPFLEMWRIIQNARRRLAGQDREAGEGEEGEVGEDEESTHDVESESESDTRDDLQPHHQHPVLIHDQPDYDADNSGNDGESSSTTPAPGLNPELESDHNTASSTDQATASLHVEPQQTPSATMTTNTTGATRWYGHDSSSEQEWPMSLPMTLSDWSNNSFTQSNSSWETEEVEEIIGGVPSNEASNELQEEQEGENWESEEVGETMATGTSLPMTTYTVQSSAYDAHIRLDQNGTAIHGSPDNDDDVHTHTT